MQDATLPVLDWYFADYQLNGRLHQRHGNRRPGMVRGAYPCEGDDRWLALSCFDEAEWQALVAVAGQQEWLDDARFATLAQRLANQDALDAAIARYVAVAEGRAEARPSPRVHAPGPGGRDGCASCAGA